MKREGLLLCNIDEIMGTFYAWDPKRDFLDEYHSLTKRMIRGDYDAYNKLKRLRIRVFRHTVAVVSHGWYLTESKKKYAFPDDADMINNTMRYRQGSIVPSVFQIPQNADPTIIEVENIDCLHAGEKLKLEGYNPAVLNMAMEHDCVESTGDGVNEEALLRTNLFCSLSRFCYNKVEMSGFESRDFEKELFYTPNAIYFRENEQNGYALLDYPITLSFISAAGEFNFKGQSENHTIPDGSVEPFKNKIRSIFRIGLIHGHDSLILGSLGCGAFHMPPRHVARLFHEVMDEGEFKNKYRRIVFAILDDYQVYQPHNPEGNYKPFFNEFTRFNVESDFKKWLEVHEIHLRTLEAYQTLIRIRYSTNKYVNHLLTPKIDKACLSDMYLLREDLRGVGCYYGGYSVFIHQYLALLDKMGQPVGYYCLEFNHHGKIVDDWYLLRSIGNKTNKEDEKEAPLESGHFSVKNGEATIAVSPGIRLGEHVKAIDLGLPSCTKWANCNVGANRPEEYGCYFAWGEVSEKRFYNWDTYAFLEKNDSKCISGSSDDVAYSKWGKEWQMPTLEQIEELLTNCSYDRITFNGVKGGLFTGPNGNSIFLPAAGGRFKSELYHDGEYGFYWSGDVFNSEESYNIFFDCDDVSVSPFFIRYGFTIRPVVTQ